MEETGNYYVINHIALATGLSDRTIRNYIATGILIGEKINGIWHFTPEQVDAFIKHPTVRPGIVAKQNGLVYDFLAENKKSSSQICVILDIPTAMKKEFAEFFCYEITNGDFHNILFSFDGVFETPRVILRGVPAEVLSVLECYRRRFDL